MLDTTLDSAVLPDWLLDRLLDRLLDKPLDRPLDNIGLFARLPAFATLENKEVGAFCGLFVWFELLFAALFRSRLVRYECHLAIIELVRPFAFDVAFSRLLSTSAAGWPHGGLDNDWLLGRIGELDKF